MNDYIVKVRYDLKSILKKIDKFRIPAIDEKEAAKIAIRHPYFPHDGEIVSVKKAAYKKSKP
jgi:hypothetical protein